MELKSSATIPERALHIALKVEGGKCQRGDGAGCAIASNSATTPGDMTERGCTYAGCRGVVGGPVKDAIQLTHGPIGCAFFSWGYRPHLADTDFHMKYTFVSDMNETNIVFGGEKKLLQSIIEASQEFPEAKAVFVYNTCSTALIGDDGRDVAKQAEAIIGKSVVFFECEGFKGVSQSAGHHVGNETIFRQLVGSVEPEGDFSRTINIVGDYNIRHPHLRASLRGDRPTDRHPLHRQCRRRRPEDHAQGGAQRRPLPALSHLHRRHDAGEVRHAVHQRDALGHEAYVSGPARHGGVFGLEAEAEEVIERELAKIKPKIDYYRQRLTGKKVFIYQGGPRTWHWIELLRELGMETQTAATTFGHEDDYEKIFEQLDEGGMMIDNPNVPELEEILTKRRPTCSSPATRRSTWPTSSACPS